MALGSLQNMQRCAGAVRPSARPAPFSSRPVPSTRSAFQQTGSQQAQQRLAGVRCRAAEVAEAPTEEARAHPKGKTPHPSTLNQGAPETYAIVEIGGHQMFVEPGKWYTCNRLQAEPSSKIRFGRVLAIKAKDSVQIGAPYLEDVAVEAEVVEELRGPKVIVYKMKPKKHYRRTRGHRQDLTKFLVTKVGNVTWTPEAK